MTERAGNLIIVPGHAAFRGSVQAVPDDPDQDKYWVLQPFQAGEPTYYIEHIKQGIELLKHDLGGIALMSGGRTRLAAGHWSEAATYLAIAEANSYWQDDGLGAGSSLADRVDVEAYARDSLENLQNSLYRYYQITGGYPRHVTVVGWAFKQQRFDYHRATLGIPEENFTYLGINNPPDVSSALVGEERTLQAFRTDPWAEEGVLKQKRQERNPFNETNTYDNLPPILIQPGIVR